MTSGILTPKRFQAAITNTTFINFDQQECSAIRTCSGCIMGQGKKRSRQGKGVHLLNLLCLHIFHRLKGMPFFSLFNLGGFTVKTHNLKFLNSPRKVFFPFPHCALIKDIDGSVSGSEGRHLLVDPGILPVSSCWAVDYVSGGASGRVCEADVTFHRMSIAL